jgi:hypothetical protein
MVTALPPGKAGLMPAPGVTSSRAGKRGAPVAPVASAAWPGRLSTKKDMVLPGKVQGPRLRPPVPSGTSQGKCELGMMECLVEAGMMFEYVAQLDMSMSLERLLRPDSASKPVT